MPEMVWRAYIDNEIELKEYDNVRSLYSRLLEKAQHLKIWLSYAEFEASLDEKEKARSIMQKGDLYFRDKPEMKEQRAMLYEQWLMMEIKF